MSIVPRRIEQGIYFEICKMVAELNMLDEKEKFVKQYEKYLNTMLKQLTTKTKMYVIKYTEKVIQNELFGEISVGFVSINFGFEIEGYIISRSHFSKKVEKALTCIIDTYRR